VPRLTHPGFYHIRREPLSQFTPVALLDLL
jgi:hypothetical protein